MLLGLAISFCNTYYVFPFKNPDAIALQILSTHKDKIQMLFVLCSVRWAKNDKQMLSTALGKVEKKERNIASSFCNIFGNVGLQNKKLRIYFMVVYLSFRLPWKSIACCYELITIFLFPI